MCKIAGRKLAVWAITKFGAPLTLSFIRGIVTKFHRFFLGSPKDVGPWLARSEKMKFMQNIERKRV